MVGSADFNNEEISGQIDMAIAPRQPGSAIKPFTYLAAFEMPAAVTEQNPPTPDPNAPVDADQSAIEPPGYWTPSTAIMDITTQFPDGANPPYVPTITTTESTGWSRCARRWRTPTISRR